jgi:hypothetical protein
MMVSKLGALSRWPSSSSSITSVTAPVSAMKPSLTCSTSRRAMATMVSRNQPTTMAANRGSGIRNSIPAVATGAAVRWPVRKPYAYMAPRVTANVAMRIGNEDGRPNCQIKSLNSAPATLWSICGGRSPISNAVPMKLALNPIIRITGVAGMPMARASGNATGAIIRMVTTLSTNIEITPASTERIITSRPGCPPESRMACTASQLGTPVFPK